MSKSLSVIVWSKQGCSYCSDIKIYLENKKLSYQTVDITNHDDYRDILEVKYGVRHVPVVEIGRGGVYEAVTEVGIEYLENTLKKFNNKRI